MGGLLWTQETIWASAPWTWSRPESCPPAADDGFGRLVLRLHKLWLADHRDRTLAGRNARRSHHRNRQDCHLRRTVHQRSVDRECADGCRQERYGKLHARQPDGPGKAPCEPAGYRRIRRYRRYHRSPRGHSQRDQFGPGFGELPRTRLGGAMVRLRHFRHHFGRFLDQQFATPRLPDHGLPEWLLPGRIHTAIGSVAAPGSERWGGSSPGLERTEPGAASNRP